MRRAHSANANVLREHMSSIIRRRFPPWSTVATLAQHTERGVKSGGRATVAPRCQTIRNKLQRLVHNSYLSSLHVVINLFVLCLCCVLGSISTKGHVLAVRRGRLMSPSTFTALSGDLHVQIQFTADEDDDDEQPHLTRSGNGAANRTGNESGTGLGTTQLWPENQNLSNAHLSTDEAGRANGTIMSTLVISKIINDEPGNRSVGSEQVLQRRRKEIVQNIPLFPDPRQNVTQVTVPCQTFVRGGLYEMQVIRNLRTTTLNRSDTAANGLAKGSSTPVTTTTLMPAQDERLLQTLDVRWPSAEMIVSPVTLRTYPKSPVNVTLRFPEVNCEGAQHGELPALPEFWLELVYCGKDRTCAHSLKNVSKSSVLFAEQIHGFPKLKTLQLGCELFGLAGNYAVQLRPMTPALNVPTTRRMLSVDWSDEFVFNVYARSIFPCDPHSGVGVLYEYPGCILEQGDRVRLYAKLRADVASLKPPTSLHYVAEQRVVKSQHSLYFNCELFSEKYVEYCFVYVSQAISGAVADVRMDCVPTLPVSGKSIRRHT